MISAGTADGLAGCDCAKAAVANARNKIPALMRRRMNTPLKLASVAKARKTGS
jgi:hypothetical protein